MAPGLEHLTQRPRWARLFVLLVSQALFLWMYLSTHSVEQMADAGLLQGRPGADIRTWAARYAAGWRHGLVGLWPVYVPGFFAVTLATWFWAIGCPLRRLAVELVVLTSAALGGALLFAPAGAGLVLNDMMQDLGISATGPVSTPAFSGVLLATYSVLARNAFVVACHRALQWRSFWPLLVPAVLDLILYVIRPFTADDLAVTWLTRAASGDLLACTWLAAVPIFSGFMAATELPKVPCILFGHLIDNRPIRSSQGEPRCRCGALCLTTGGRITRVRHNLKCFFGGHHYTYIGGRHGHHEYVCVECGHPLLLEQAKEGHPRKQIFHKMVHYACGIRGHRVHTIVKRNAATEYACACGHSFLQPHPAGTIIRHPLRCVLFGHAIAFLGRRSGYYEYVCQHCGHPFMFGRVAHPPRTPHR